MIGAVVCFICCPILRMTFFMFCGVPRLVGGIEESNTQEARGCL